jgi:dTDP-4-amino-4,6-dideoxygalactose transaminase
MIPFKKINLGKAYEQIKPLFESGMIGLGSVVTEFENELAAYLGAKYVVATSSCTSALFLSLKWERVHKGRTNIFIPSMTVPLVYDAAHEAGMNVAFDMRTDWVGSHYQISGSSVFDSAHELRRDQFSTMKKRYMLDDLSVCFSFYPTKTVGSADGGAIATDDKEFAEWAKQQTTYGRTADQYKSLWDYDVVDLGHKLHYTNLQAAIALEQLKRLDETNERRRGIARWYTSELGNDEHPAQSPEHSDYLYRIDVPQRDYFLEYMKKNGIECNVHFKPLHLMTPFKDVVMYGKESVEEAFKKTVSLPFYDLLTNEEIEYIIKTVKEYFGSLSHHS